MEGIELIFLEIENDLQQSKFSFLQDKAGPFERHISSVSVLTHSNQRSDTNGSFLVHWKLTYITKVAALHFSTQQ